MAKIKNIKEKFSPEKVVLKETQIKRLSQFTDVSAEELRGKTIAELESVLKWRIDPKYLLFKRICGKVVKKDAATGIEYPVPFATVQVEDTDFNLLWYQPASHPWAWFFPLGSHREVIATTQTDACGNFCVWIPRFDIDWILRWRRERICFPIAFKRPRLADIFEGVIPFPEPGPGPDPWKEIFNLSASRLQAVAGSKSETLLKQVTSLKNSAVSGAIDDESRQLLDQRLFDHEVPPPLPMDFQKALSGIQVVASKEASPKHAIRTAVAEKLGGHINPKELERFDPHRYIGPFYRCYDFFVPEWQMVLDVPDLTFRVTQDVNGDGTEETIYSEGYFDVRWNSGSLSNVTLQASSIARESRFCHVPDVACGNVPALLHAGMMPLNDSAYFDVASGYALRPNRPRSGSTPYSPARTPLWGAIAFSGCVDVQHAKYYRLLQSTNGGASYSAITGYSWNYFIVAGPSVPITADANGWYPVEPIHPGTGNPVPRNSLLFPSLIFDWLTPRLQNTKLRLEIGTATKAHIAYSADVAIQSDNTVPDILFTQLSWKYAGEPDAMLRDLNAAPCPMIKRGATPRDIEVVFQASVSSAHLRECSLATSGCGGGSFTTVGSTLNASHWHQTVWDNSVVLTQRYALSALSMPGCYSFTCHATDRSVNPAAPHGENLLPPNGPDWYEDRFGLYTYLSKSVAIVNENL